MADDEPRDSGPQMPFSVRHLPPGLAKARTVDDYRRELKPFAEKLREGNIDPDALAEFVSDESLPATVRLQILNVFLSEGPMGLSVAPDHPLAEKFNRILLRRPPKGTSGE